MPVTRGEEWNANKIVTRGFPGAPYRSADKSDGRGKFTAGKLLPPPTGSDMPGSGSGRGGNRARRGYDTDNDGE